jgi:hypothetical protein
MEETRTHGRQLPVEETRTLVHLLQPRLQFRVHPHRLKEVPSHAQPALTLVVRSPRRRKARMKILEMVRKKTMTIRMMFLPRRRKRERPREMRMKKGRARLMKMTKRKKAKHHQMRMRMRTRKMTRKRARHHRRKRMMMIMMMRTKVRHHQTRKKRVMTMTRESPLKMKERMKMMRMSQPLQLKLAALVVPVVQDSSRVGAIGVDIRVIMATAITIKLDGLIVHRPLQPFFEKAYDNLF